MYMSVVIAFQIILIIVLLVKMVKHLLMENVDDYNKIYNF